MTNEPLIVIRMRGKESISEAVQFIKEHHNVELELPANYHHACFSHLYPASDPGEPDFIDVSDGEQIISKIAEVAGLELFCELLKPVKQSGAKVVMKSPPPRIYIGFDYDLKGL